MPSSVKVDGRRGRPMPRGEACANFRHGHAAGDKSPEYLSWRAMTARCNNSGDPAYPRYGGRGITVCVRWSRFENFFEDMDPRPLGLTIERVNNDGDYEPGNCVWATPKRQARNKRDNNLITVNGVTQCITDWAAAIGLNPRAITWRIKNGWSEGDAVTTSRTTTRGPPSRRG